MKIRTIFAAPVIMLSACLTAMPQTKSRPSAQTVLTAPLDPAQTKMIFRYEYSNFARGFRREGWYIDAGGNVYSYKYKLAQTGQPGRSLDFETAPTLTARLAPKLIAEKLKLSSKATRGKLSQKSAAFDAGIETYSAFLINPSTHKFDEIKLKESGDIDGTNHARAAIKLVEWLKTVFIKS